MKEVNEIISKAVLVEKAPFRVVIYDCQEESTNGTELLVRQCVSEDELKSAREKQSWCEEPYMVSFNPMEYYVIIKGGRFVGNIVEKGICKRVKTK